MLACIARATRSLLSYRKIFFTSCRLYTSSSDGEKYANSRPIYNFTSNTFSPSDIVTLFRACRLEYKERSSEYVVKYCPLCPKPHLNKLDNLFKLNISKSNGLYMCFRCGAKGSWAQFKKAIFDNRPQELSEGIESISTSVGIVEDNLISKAYERYIGLKSKLFPNSIKYLTGNDPELGERGLSLETLEKYKVGIGFEKFRNDNNEYVPYECIWFPMYSPTKKAIPYKSEIDKLMGEVINTPHVSIAKTKCRAYGKENKARQRIEPIGSKSVGYFGLNTIPADSKNIVITEGEFDAMAVHQATGLPSISLPYGANYLPVESLPWFKGFEKIYLWMDNDEAGKKNCERFANKLGANKTFIVDTSKLDPINPPKDANDALRAGKNLNSYIKAAKPIPQENIITFSDIKTEVINKLAHYKQSSGLQSQSFNWYNKKLKGFRRGELTIITGSTGSGKTTFLSQLSLDFLQQGTSTIWGSFEIKNEVLASTMLLQYSKVDLTTKKDEILRYANDFEVLPLYFLKYFGTTPVDELMVTLEYAIYAYDLNHIIIDNMQFLLSGQGKGFERFDIQDEFISKLRKLVSEKNIHVTLVIHPKKVDEDTQDLTISSVFGSAKATQEADNIMIIQNRHKYRHIDIRKNRFDGDTGRVAVGFCKEIRSFIELTDDEVMELNTRPITMDDIYSRRKSKMGSDAKYKKDKKTEPSKPAEKTPIGKPIDNSIKPKENANPIQTPNNIALENIKQTIPAFNESANNKVKNKIETSSPQSKQITNNIEQNMSDKLLQNPINATPLKPENLNPDIPQNQSNVNKETQKPDVSEILSQHVNESIKKIIEGTKQQQSSSKPIDSIKASINDINQPKINTPNQASKEIKSDQPVNPTIKESKLGSPSEITKSAPLEQNKNDAVASLPKKQIKSQIKSTDTQEKSKDDVIISAIKQDSINQVTKTNAKYEVSTKTPKEQIKSKGVKSTAKKSTSSSDYSDGPSRHTDDKLIGYPEWIDENAKGVTSFIEQTNEKEKRSTKIIKEKTTFSDLDGVSMSEREKHKLYKMLKDGGHLSRKLKGPQGNNSSSSKNNS